MKNITATVALAMGRDAGVGVGLEFEVWVFKILKDNFFGQPKVQIHSI
jgi:hypothetical protein